MKKGMAFVAGLAFAASLSSCSMMKKDGEDKSDETAKAGGAAETETVMVSADVEVSCAKCTYKVAALTECAPAAKFHDGKVVLLENSNLDVEKDGICMAARPARVKGEMKGGKFVVASLEFTENDPATKPHPDHAHPSINKDDAPAAKAADKPAAKAEAKPAAKEQAKPAVKVTQD